MFKFSNLLITAGLTFIVSALIIFILTFYPVILAEVNYQTHRLNLNPQAQSEIQPIDSQFGIVVPKIGANSPIIADVNPFQEKEYQWALTKGVAQAKGTALPGQNGNMFLFSHSTANFYEVGRYNAIFYLLNKLEQGDEIDIYYKGEKFKYIVNQIKVVDPKAVNYLDGDPKKAQVTLMTCTPAGTSFRRLMIIGELSQIIGNRSQEEQGI